MNDPLSHARALLQSVFGFGAFRPGQEEIVRAVLAGENVLAVMPTGSGKSLCFQLPAIARPGLTLVVSPLIALMRDQVQALTAAGVAAGSLNSSNESSENARVMGLLRRGELRLLYVAPERLARPDTVEMLAEAQVTMMAIDEAHCVSQWGHDFRPDYLTLGNLARQIGGRLQTLAFTATADAPTRGDIVEKLFATEPRVFVRSFDRPNLKLAFRPKERSTRQVLSFVQAHPGESGIVYCSSRRKVEELAEALKAAGRWPRHRVAGARRCSPISARPRKSAATAISARKASSCSMQRSMLRRRCPPSCVPVSASAWSISSPS